MIFRFVNVLNGTQNDNAVWKIVKEIRIKFLIDSVEPQCNKYKTLIDLSNIDKNIKAIENKLNLETNDERKDNITKDILTKGAQMFTYLNFCPPKELTKYLKELLFSGEIKAIIIGLTNVIKTRRTAEKNSAMRLWMKISEKYLHMHNEDIDLFTKASFLKMIQTKVVKFCDFFLF